MTTYKSIEEILSEMTSDQLLEAQRVVNETVDALISMRMEMRERLQKLKDESILPDSNIDLSKESHKMRKEMNDMIFNRMTEASLLTRDMASDFSRDNLDQTFDTDKYKAPSHYRQFGEAIEARLAILKNKEQEFELKNPFLDKHIRVMELKELAGAKEILSALTAEYKESMESAVKQFTDEKDISRAEQDITKAFVMKLDENGLLTQRIYKAYNTRNPDYLNAALSALGESIDKETANLQDELEQFISSGGKTKKKQSNSIVRKAFDAVVEHNSSKAPVPDNPRLVSSAPKSFPKKKSFLWGNTLVPWPVYPAVLGLPGLYILVAELLVRKAIDLVKGWTGKNKQTQGVAAESTPKEYFLSSVKNKKYENVSRDYTRARNPDHDRYLREKDERNREKAERQTQQLVNAANKVPSYSR